LFLKELGGAVVPQNEIGPFNFLRQWQLLGNSLLGERAMYAYEILQEAARRGLLLLTCGAWGEVVRFIPALIVNSAQVKEAATLWEDAVAAAS